MSRIVSRVVSGLIFCVCLLAPASAQQGPQQEGLGGIPDHLEKHSFRVGNTSFDLYAESSVDVDALVADIRRGDTAQEIYDKVNAVRQQRRYRDDEIILSIGGPVEQEVSLVRLISRWNASGSWWAQYNSNNAIFFIDDASGTCLIYSKAGGGWIYRSTVRTGGALSRGEWGSYILRGYYSLASGSCRADLIWWFFS